MMDQAKRLVMQTFDEIDGCLEYCRFAKSEQQDREVADAYSSMASSKLDSASTLMGLAGKRVSEQEGDGAWNVLSEIIDARIQSARSVLSMLGR